jgi:hypothetical protein
MRIILICETSCWRSLGPFRRASVCFDGKKRTGEWNCKLYGISGGQQLLITLSQRREKEREGGRRPPTTALISWPALACTLSPAFNS